MKTKLLIAFTIIASLGFAQKNVSKNYINAIPKGYIYIPSGKFIINNQEKTVQAFYMLQTEVSNGEYQEFLNDLKANNRTKELNIAKIQSGNWNDFEITEADEYAKSYENWKSYPVVNISKEAAALYCKWLTENIRKESGIKNTPEFRLPEKEEWIWAAKSNLDDEDFPWVDIKDKKGNYKMQVKAFGNTLGPVKTLDKTPNNYGLYNICGNVAEYISGEDIVMGGSWNEHSKNAKVYSTQKSKISPTIGFRPVISYITE